MRPAEVHFQLRVELMGQREIGIELQGALEFRFRLAQAVACAGFEVLRHHVVNSPEARPRRSVIRILLDGAQVQIARYAHCLES